MLRKKRQPGPFFHMPGAPFAPIKGEDSPLGRHALKGTTLALFQVVAGDTHDNYVECRGYEVDVDPTFTHIHDPYAFPSTTPINVAKPYGVRGTFPYTLGQVIVAARIFTKFGFTPGKAATTVGQPADLDEAIGILLDDAGTAISWMDLSTSPGLVIHRGVLDEAATKHSSTTYTVSRYNPGTTVDSGTNDEVIFELIDVGPGKVVHYFKSGDNFYHTSVECPNT